MPALIAHRPRAAGAPTGPARASLGNGAFYFMTAVVAIQGGHVVEHIIQVVQVFVLGVAEDDALGLLGYVLQFNGTEEWLHLGYNTLYLIALYALILPLWRITPAVLSRWAFWFYIGASVWVETWHMVEHGVIISHVIANHGCPCPGIGDAALNVSDTILHFFYNAIAYAGIVYAYILVLRDRGYLFHPPPPVQPPNDSPAPAQRDRLLRSQGDGPRRERTFLALAGCALAPRQREASPARFRSALPSNSAPTS